MALSVNIRQVVKATKLDLDIGASILAKAFETDDFMQVCVGHLGYETIVAFQRGVISAAAKGGLLYFAYNENNDVIGVAAWFQPGHAFLLEPEQGVDGLNELFQSFPADLSKWWTEIYLPQYNEQSISALGEGFKLNAWHLSMIGVLPDKQRRGVGTALIKIGENMAEAEKKTVVLEAAEDDNVEKFYKKIGYIIKPSGPPEHPDYVIYNDAKGNYGFNMWVMAKEFS